MKKYLVLLVASSVSLLNAAKPEGTMIIDAFKVMGESEAGQRLQRQIEQKQRRYTDEISKEQQKLAEMRSELQTKAATLAPKAIEEKRLDMQRREEDLARLAREYEQDLQNEMQQASQMLMADVRIVAEKMGKERNLRLVQDRSGAILYIADELDSTSEVIQAMNAQHVAQGKGNKSMAVAKADEPRGRKTT